MTLDIIRRIAIGAVVVLAGCAGADVTSGNGEESDSQVTDNAAYGEYSAIVGQQAKVVATDGLHLRTGAGTGYAVILTLPDGAIVPVLGASNGWYRVDYTGHVGWCSGAFLVPVGGGGGGGGGVVTTPVARAAERAQSGVGFSYHWGAGCWSPGAAHGACYGSCPNCSHAGAWGADCSGYVAKVWQVPGTSALTTCTHPYSTWNFDNTHDHWSDVSRASVKKMDAFVYNSGSEGHIFLYDSGDRWGWVSAYECKGCSYGCVHDSRVAYSMYKPIRREGY